MAIAREAVVTFDRIDGYRVVRTFGYVSGSAQRRRNLLGATFRSLSALIGLAPSEWVTDAEALRDDALDQLRAAGDKLGANAVLRLQFHASESGEMSKIVAFGEAVVIEKENPPQE